jgi:hypothetical protein
MVKLAPNRFQGIAGKSNPERPTHQRRTVSIERRMGKLKKQRKGEVWKAEVGPAVVPNGRNYGAASMRPPARRGHRGLRPGGKAEKS